MSKVEELSRRYVLPFLDKQYEKYGEHEQMQLSKFDGYDMMSAYEKGYYQAEKDLELGWKDMFRIDEITSQVYKDSDSCQTEVIYQEVLKRFKAHKGK